MKIYLRNYKMIKRDPFHKYYKLYLNRTASLSHTNCLHTQTLTHTHSFSLFYTHTRTHKYYVMLYIYLKDKHTNVYPETFLISLH